MKKSELKNIIKPIINECLYEALFDGGILSKIISEVAVGLTLILKEQRRIEPAFVLEDDDDNENEAIHLQEKREAYERQRKSKINQANEVHRQRQQRNKSMTMKMGGVDLFEGVQPINEKESHAPVGDHIKESSLEELDNEFGDKWRRILAATGPSYRREQPPLIKNIEHTTRGLNNVKSLKANLEAEERDALARTRKD